MTVKFTVALIVSIIIFDVTSVNAKGASTKEYGGFTCAMVKDAARIFGADQIETFARSRGIGEAKIEKAKRCLTRVNSKGIE